MRRCGIRASDGIDDVHRYKTVRAVAERRDGVLFFCASAKGGLGRDDVFLAVVSPGGRAKVARAWIAVPGDVDRTLWRIVRGTTCDFASGSFDPAPLPGNVPGKPSPRWQTCGPGELRDVLFEAETLPAVAVLAEALDTELLGLSGRCFGEDGRGYDLLATRPDARRDVVDAVARHPWLLRGMTLLELAENAVAARMTSTGLFSGGGDVAALAFLSDRRWSTRHDEGHPAPNWPISIHAVRRLAGVGNESIFSRMHLRFLSALPPDWIPEPGTEAWDVSSAFARLTDDLALRRPADLLPLLGGLKGDFEALSARIARMSGAEGGRDVRVRAFRDAVGRIGDAVTAMRRDVVGPAFEIGGLGFDDRDMILVARTLLGMGGFASSFEIAQRWHAQERTIRAAAHPSDVRTWRQTTKTWKAPNGLDVVPLVSAFELDAEGMDGVDADGVRGMDHCVGTRAQDCADGRSRVYSVRRSSGRSFERVSTFEIRMKDGMPKIVEHRGPGNSDPPHRAMEAVAHWTKAIAVGTLELDADAMAPTGRFHLPDSDARQRLRLSIPAWSALMKRRFRHLEPDDMAFAAMEILEEPLVGPSDPGR